MAGAWWMPSGQVQGCSQSNSEGHSTVKENCTWARIGSKPVGGSSLPEPATSAKR